MNWLEVNTEQGKEGPSRLWQIVMYRIGPALNPRFTITEPEDEEHSEPKEKKKKKTIGGGKMGVE
jgi:hypothetical protein